MTGRLTMSRPGLHQVGVRHVLPKVQALVKKALLLWWTLNPILLPVSSWILLTWIYRKTCKRFDISNWTYGYILFMFNKLITRSFLYLQIAQSWRETQIFMWTNLNVVPNVLCAKFNSSVVFFMTITCSFQYKCILYYVIQKQDDDVQNYLSCPQYTNQSTCTCTVNS